MPLGLDKPDATWWGHDTVYPPGGGSYADASAWSTGKVPDQNYDVVLPVNTHPYTVTHDTVTPAVYRLTIRAGATLRSSAPLSVVDYTQVDGRLDLRNSLSSGFLYGTGMVSGHGIVSAIFGAAHTGAGIVPTSLRLNASGGTLELDGSSPFQSHIGGLLSGQGTIDFHGGAFVFNNGTNAKVADLAVSGADIWLTQDFRYGGRFNFSGGTISLVDGETLQQGDLVLSGNTTLGAGEIQGSGTDFSLDPFVYLRGSTTLAGGTEVHDALVENFGQITQIGDLTLDHSTFINAANSVYLFAQDGDILTGADGAGTFVNRGVVGKAGGFVSAIETDYVNNGGTQVSVGDLDMDGDVTGKGVFAIDNDARLWFSGSVGSGQRIEFGSVGDGMLALVAAGSFHGTVANMTAGDTINLRGFVPYHATLAYHEKADHSGGVLTISTIAHQKATIAFSGDYDAGGFHLDPNFYGSSLTYAPPGGAHGLIAASGR